MLVTLVLKHFF